MHAHTYKQVLTLGLCVCFTVVFGQDHVAPIDGEDGIPGAVSNSFRVEWAAVEGAVDYEYVMSDNPQCFAGCAGDTRQEKTNGVTSATEYALGKNRWYYWITRVFYADGGVSNWSSISSFLARSPETSEVIANVNPNPVTNTYATIDIDWQLHPKATFLRIEFFSYSGNRQRNDLYIQRLPDVRFQSFRLDVAGMDKGVYLLRYYIDGNLNNPNTVYHSKLVIAQ